MLRRLLTGFDDVWCCFVRVLLEVIDKEPTKLGDLLLEISRANPRFLRVQKLLRNTGARFWDIEVEGLVSLVLSFGKLSRVDSIEDGSSVFQPSVVQSASPQDEKKKKRFLRASLATGSGASANPACIQEPGVRIMFLDLV